MTYLLAYPRTASNWLLFVLEYCTGIAVAGPDGIPDSTINMVKIGQPVGANTPVILWAHRFCDFHSNIKDDGSTLICVHRNRIEVCVSLYASQRKADPDKLVEQLHREPLPPSLISLVEWHRENGKKYDDWKGPKLWIEYEDLVSNLPEVLQQLESILPFDRSRTEEFTAHAQQYQQEFFAWKVKAGKSGLPVNTFGDFLFWRNKLNDKTKAAIEAL